MLFFLKCCAAIPCEAIKVDKKAVLRIMRSMVTAAAADRFDVFPDSVSRVSFPSPGIIARIKKLPPVDASPTIFKGKSPGAIAEMIVKQWGGRIEIDVSKASEPEIDAIREAANISVGDFKPAIIIHGDGEEEAQALVAEENSILRAILEETFADGEVNVGREGFGLFIRTFLTDPANYHLVREEWNRFIVGHPHTGKIHSPYEAHHFHNLGLKYASEGPDSLRDQYAGFIKGVLEPYRDNVRSFFEESGGRMFVPHSSPKMNTLDARMFLTGNAEGSNYFRGGAYLRHRRRNQPSPKPEYQPRIIAAGIIDKVRAKYRVAAGI